MDEPTRASVDSMPGAVVLEFGTTWCGHCRAAQPIIGAALSPRPQVRHIRIEDGAGRALGRSYGVKLWPTLVFLRNGHEVARRVRPVDVDSVQTALALTAA